MANLMELLERGALQSPRSLTENLYINAGRVPGAQGVDSATGFFTGVDKKILSVRNPETGKFGPVKAIEAPVSTAKAIPSSERYLQEQLDRWSGEGGASGAERPAPSTSLVRVEPEARPDPNFVMRPEGPTDVVPWTGSVSGGEAATNRALTIANQANIAGGRPMRLPPEAGENMASSPPPYHFWHSVYPEAGGRPMRLPPEAGEDMASSRWAPVYPEAGEDMASSRWAVPALGAMAAGAYGAANLPLRLDHAHSATAGGGGNAPSATAGGYSVHSAPAGGFSARDILSLIAPMLLDSEPLEAPNRNDMPPPGNLPTSARGNTPPKESTPTTAIPTPPRRPANLGSSAASVSNPSILDRIFSGQQYQSSAPANAAPGASNALIQNGKINWGDESMDQSGSKADFVRASKALQDTGDSGMARGGAAKASGKGGHDAIHKALEIIHHLIGGQYSHG